MTPREKLLALLAKRNPDTKLRDRIESDIPERKEIAQNTSGIRLNDKQKLAVEYAETGESFCITGPAGTGKTFTIERVINRILSSSRNRMIMPSTHKHLPKTSVPGIVVVSFTNKAVNNLKKKLPLELRGNCLTMHKLLEYGPEDFLMEDGSKSRRFVPYRNKNNPLPSGIHTIIIEEATMTDVPLFNELMEAMPEDMFDDLQLILVGDIQQLPPVFGKSIFIHAMERGIKTVELTEVYRQKGESPILELAHRILSGKIIPAKELPEWTIDKLAEGLGKVYMQPWKKDLSTEAACLTLKSVLPKMIDAGVYDPFEDIILCPFNKSFGTIMMNEAIASHVAKKLDAEVWEIFTGIQKVYFRIGERVLFQKSEARITDIKINPSYYGKVPRDPSKTMNYEGHESNPATEMTEEQADKALANVEKWLEAMGSHVDEDESTSQQASHIITVVSEDTGQEYQLKKAGEITGLDLGYAISVHKSQGSEYRKVFFITHKSNNIMAYRELVYTAVTRAKEELHIICDPTLFTKGINTQRVPGKNVQEKIENFQKLMQKESKWGSGNIDQIPRGLERFIGER